jgi:hypothetical protein
MNSLVQFQSGIKNLWRWTSTARGGNHPRKGISSLGRGYPCPEEDIFNVFLQAKIPPPNENIIAFGKTLIFIRISLMY